MDNLIFIPYQDIFDFTNTGILTREYALLHIIKSKGIKNIYSVSKPRTILDKKELKKIQFPHKSVEFDVYHEILKSDKIRYEPFFDISLLFKKREWWIKGYKNTIKLIESKNINYKNTIVYSNNPFSYELLYDLKQKGATIYFDIMDNLAVHPSLNITEQTAAIRCYEKIFLIADFVTCNSKSILEFCNEKFKKEPILIKNGVFPNRDITEIFDIDTKHKINELLTLKKKYKMVAGYIGKLGLRLDEKLIEKVITANPEVLFVFLGPHLKAQRNNGLEKLFNKYENIISLGSIQSSYINFFLNQFSLLIIPHSVGKFENGGDPLKLYQYLNTGKPIISTTIDGVGEFKNIITISNDANEWNSFIKNVFSKNIIEYEIPNSIYWNERLKPLSRFLEK